MMAVGIVKMGIFLQGENERREPSNSRLEQGLVWGWLDRNLLLRASVA